MFSLLFSLHVSASVAHHQVLFPMPKLLDYIVTFLFLVLLSTNQTVVSFYWHSLRLFCLKCFVFKITSLKLFLFLKIFLSWGVIHLSRLHMCLSCLYCCSQLLWICSTHLVVFVTPVMCSTHILYILFLFYNVMCVYYAFYLLAPAVLVLSFSIINTHSIRK
jgi:hypothetical protein